MGRLQVGVRRAELDSKLHDLRKELMSKIEALEEQVAHLEGKEFQPRSKPAQDTKADDEESVKAVIGSDWPDHQHHSETANGEAHTAPVAKPRGVNFDSDKEKEIE